MTPTQVHIQHPHPFLLSLLVTGYNLAAFQVQLLRYQMSKLIEK